MVTQLNTIKSAPSSVADKYVADKMEPPLFHNGCQVVKVMT